MHIDDSQNEFSAVGNIFDDLKALAEPLKDFDTEYAADIIRWRLSPQCRDLIIDTAKDTYIIRKSDISKFILNLQRLVHTAEQEAH